MNFVLFTDQLGLFLLYFDRPSNSLAKLVLQMRNPTDLFVFLTWDISWKHNENKVLSEKKNISSQFSQTQNFFVHYSAYLVLLVSVEPGSQIVDLEIAGHLVLVVLYVEQVLTQARRFSEVVMQDGDQNEILKSSKHVQDLGY